MIKKTLLIKSVLFIILSITGLLQVNGAEWKRDIYVNQDGSGDYTTITEALEGIRAFMDYTVTVHIANGVYHEKLVIPAWLQKVRFIGENMDSTIITNSDHANINNMGTFRTYTMRVDACDATFENLTIENDAPQLGQAVALHTEGDKLIFRHCRLLGNQDTLYTAGHFSRVYFEDCYIEGTTDFIFGPATAYFKNCEIVSKANSYVTAASTPADRKYGYIFNGCRLRATDGINKVYLGRPWRPYAHTVFIDCELGPHILKAGWHNWNDPANEATARYGEYGSTGPGADTSERVPWVKTFTEEEINVLRNPASVFSISGDWDPSLYIPGSESNSKNKVPMGNVEEFTEVKIDLPICDGPFSADWESIEENYPGTPDWLRKAKIGFWVHFGPQASGQSGDWYARNLYKEGQKAYSNHLKNFGHPSKIGYKDVLKDWNPVKLDPDSLTKLYHKAGARFLMVQGVHHDNYDLWNSAHQPWNSVNIGPKRDFLKEWSEACRKYDMRYGVTFHHEYTWWWWQTAFGSDKEGEFAGIPYDGHLTLEDGVGEWWEGYDPKLLYGIDLREYESVEEAANTQWNTPAPGIFSNHLDYAQWYATQWAQRIMDVTENYDPDFIYTDGTVQGPFIGYGTGAGFKANAMPTVMADFYNKTLKKRGNVDTFSIIKFRDPTNGAVNTAEFDFPDEIITSQPWIREAPVGDWYYAPGFTYDSGSMIKFIIEAVSRDGNVALNIPMLPDGSLEEDCVTMLEELGEWLDVNGKGIYGSSAWKILGEGETVNGKLRKLPGGGLGKSHAEFKFSTKDFRFTKGEDDAIYTFCMTLPEKGEQLRIHSLNEDNLDSPISRVKLLGWEGDLKWNATKEGLTIHFPNDYNGFAASVFQIELEGK